MYQQHFGLEKGLFATRPVGSEVFVAPQIVAAMGALKRALAASDAVITFTGVAGVGKTTLVHRALAGLSETWVTISVGRVRLSHDEVLELLLEELGAVPVPRSTVQRFALFRRTLQEFESADRRVFIVVEDATRTGIDMLLELEALTAKDAGASNGASLILMGDQDLDELLRAPDVARLKQRLRLRRTVEPLSSREMLAYLRHCCRNAGADFDDLFAADAIDVIYATSGGVIRIVNQLVETALTTASERQLSQITSELLVDSAGEQCGLTLQLPVLADSNEDAQGPGDRDDRSPDDHDASMRGPVADACTPAANDPAAGATAESSPDETQAAEGIRAAARDESPGDDIGTTVVDAAAGSTTDTATEARHRNVPEQPENRLTNTLDLEASAAAESGAEYPIEVEAGPAAVLPPGLATDQFAPNDLPAFIEETLPDLEELKQALESAACSMPDAEDVPAEPKPTNELGEEPGTQGLLCLQEPVDEENAADPSENLPVLTDSVAGMPNVEAAAADTSRGVEASGTEPTALQEASGLFLASDVLPDVDLDNLALRDPLTGATRSDADVPEWERDPTYAELKPDFDMLEEAIAESHRSASEMAPTITAKGLSSSDDRDNDVAAALDATLPADATLEESLAGDTTLDATLPGDATLEATLPMDATLEATLPGQSALEATVAQNLDDDDSANLPEITLDREIEEKITVAQTILSQTHPDLGATVAPGRLPDASGQAAASAPSDSGMRRMAGKLGDAPSLDEVSDTLAETLFGDEFRLVGAQVVADPSMDAPANDDLALIDDDATSGTGTELPAPPVSEPPVAEPASAPPPQAAASGLKRPRQSPGLDSSPSERLATLQKLNGRPLRMPTPAESVVLGETIVEEQPVVPSVPPRPIDEQIDVSITQTLDSLEVRKSLSDNEDDDSSRKRGFFSRFRRS